MSSLLLVEGNMKSRQVILASIALFFLTIIICSANNNETQDNAQDASSLRLKLVAVPEESGGICSNRDVSREIFVGSFSNGTDAQGFLSFNISEIPEDSRILSASLDFRECSIVGNPFLNIGCLKAYPVHYNNRLSPEYYYTDLPQSDIMRICSQDELYNAKKSSPEVLSALQMALGLERFQIRLQFDRPDRIIQKNTDTDWVWKKDDKWFNKDKDVMQEDDEHYSEAKVCGRVPLRIGDNKNNSTQVDENMIRFVKVRLLVTYEPL
jgi:hypothetical protein